MTLRKMQSIVMPSVSYAKCHIQALYADCQYSEYRYADCHYAECRGALGPSNESLGLCFVYKHIGKIYRFFL